MENTRLAVLSLSLIGSEPISIHEVSENTGVIIELLDGFFMKLKRESIIEYDGYHLSASQEQRMKLAIKAVNWGADPKTVCKPLGWDEFEDFAEFALKAGSYKTFKHFRFNGDKRRYEIDIIALKQPFILSIDCKHWKRSWQRAATSKIVSSQVDRTNAFYSTLSRYVHKLHIKAWNRLIIVPLVVTLSETPFKICEGTPVIPITSLQDFLNGPYLYDTSITKIIVDPKNLKYKQKKLL
jgi:Holliday junction resolvase-like predicted endonuclease